MFKCNISRSPGAGHVTNIPIRPVVDVVLPPQCTRDHDNPTEVRECNAMSTDLWGFQLDGNAMKYPIRYHLDIVKNKEWYDALGVEQFFVIVVRDDTISFTARASHCNDTELRHQEEAVGTKIIDDAINRFILNSDGEESGTTNETLKHWVAKQYQEDGHRGRRRRLSALPSRENVVVISYESMVKLGSTYVKMLYDTLGIESDVIPDNIRDANKKYLANQTFT